MSAKPRLVPVLDAEVQAQTQRALLVVPPAPKRCDNCRWWDRDLGGETGECLLFSDDPSLDRTRPRPKESATALLSVCPFAGADGATVITAAEFYCAQWTGLTPSPE